MRPSLASRLMLRIGVLVAAGAVILVTAAWYYARAAADDAYDRLLVGAVLQMTESLAVEEGELTVSLPVSAFELLGLAGQDRIFYRVIDTAGRTLTGYEGVYFREDHTAGRKIHTLAARLLDSLRPFSGSAKFG